MDIGIIGAGMIGATAARLFAKEGHAVALANSREPASLGGLVAEIGTAARAMTIDEAVAFGEVVLLAIPFGRYETLPAERFASKIVVDAMNYYPQRDGHIDFGELTSSEVVARHLPGARLVKAFNTIYYQPLATGGRRDLPVDDRLAIFVAGDDAEATDAVARLIEEIGFAPVATGALREGGQRQQAGSPIHNRQMTGSEARAALRM